MNFKKYIEENKDNILNNKISIQDLILVIEDDLYNIAKNKIYNINDIDDILQETIIKVYKNFDTLKNISAFKSWVITILLNECNKTLRKKHKDKLLFEKVKAKDTYHYNKYDIENFENNLYFYEILNTLPTIEQNIFILHYKCNYPTKEIAKILNVNENTVKSKLKRSKAKIKEKYFVNGGNINEEYK